MRMTNSWQVEASVFAKKTFNPIRHIIESMKLTPAKDKDMIALSIGDPTVFGNLNAAPEAVEAVVDVLRKGKHNGYAPSTGHETAREAVAKYCSLPEAPLQAKDIILCSGCSSSLDMCITALCSPGQTILVPRPGFPLYGTLAEGIGIKTKFYDLLPERNWEVNTEMMENLIDDTTAAIVINNPSNPCGSVFSKQHLKDILDVAERNKVPIIADEIYADFIFHGEEFHWLASLTTEVPILSCGGLTKRWIVPGWRMGWIAIHDRNGIFDKEVRGGLHALSQRVLGSNTIVQGALPAILQHTPQSFYDQTLKVVEDNAALSFELISSIPGLHPIMPQGAMYMMVGITMSKFPAFKTDLEFVETLVSEESVFCLPGKCFNITDFIRVVLTVPAEQTKEACNRIKSFCERHCADSKGSVPTNGGVVHKTHTDGHATHANGIENGTTTPISTAKHPFIRGSSYDILPINANSPEVLSYKVKTNPLKKLMKKNSILEIEIEDGEHM